MDSFRRGNSRSSRTKDEDEAKSLADRERMIQSSQQSSSWSNFSSDTGTGIGTNIYHPGLEDTLQEASLEPHLSTRHMSSPSQLFQSQFMETQRLINEQQNILLQSQAQMQMMAAVAQAQSSSMAGAGSVLPSIFSGGIQESNSLPQSSYNHRFDSSLAVDQQNKMDEEMLAWNQNFAKSRGETSTASKRQKTYGNKSMLLATNEANSAIATGSKRKIDKDQPCDLAEFAPFLQSLFPAEKAEERSVMDNSTSEDSCDLSECMEDIRAGQHASDPLISSSANHESQRILELQGKLSQLRAGFPPHQSSFCAYESQPLLGDAYTRLLSSAPAIGDDHTGHFASPGCKKKKPAKKRNKKPKDMPRRPLSGYNLFFKDERAKVLAEKERQQRDQLNYSDGASPQIKVGFERLAQIISRRWNALSEEDRLPYKARADVEMKRYREQMEAYKEKALKQKQTITQTTENNSEDDAKPKAQDSASGHDNDSKKSANEDNPPV